MGREQRLPLIDCSGQGRAQDSRVRSGLSSSVRLTNRDKIQHHVVPLSSGFSLDLDDPLIQLFFIMKRGISPIFP